MSHEVGGQRPSDGSRVFFANDNDPFAQKYLTLNSKADYIFAEAEDLANRVCTDIKSGEPAQVAPDLIILLVNSSSCKDVSIINVNRADFKSAYMKALGTSGSTLHSFVKFLEQHGRRVLAYISEIVAYIVTSIDCIRFAMPIHQELAWVMYMIPRNHLDNVSCSCCNGLYLIQSLRTFHRAYSGEARSR